jgi:hypothetical protein
MQAENYLENVSIEHLSRAALDPPKCRSFALKLISAVKSAERNGSDEEVDNTPSFGCQ